MGRAVTEQFPCLVEVVHWPLKGPRVVVVDFEVWHLGMVLQGVLTQIGLGWVASWEVGLD